MCKFKHLIEENKNSNNINNLYSKISLQYHDAGSSSILSHGFLPCLLPYRILDNIYIRFGNKLYRQIVGIPMGTNCAPLVADLFLFCYERYFMASLFDDNQADIIKAFNSTSKYLDDLLNIDNPYQPNMST